MRLIDKAKIDDRINKLLRNYTLYDSRLALCYHIQYQKITISLFNYVAYKRKNRCKTNIIDEDFKLEYDSYIDYEYARKVYDDLLELFQEEI